MTGHIICLFAWGICEKKANSKMKITVENFEEHSIKFLCEIIKGIVTMEDIHSSLILNWDCGSYDRAGGGKIFLVRHTI